jgi:putative transposase
MATASIFQVPLHERENAVTTPKVIDPQSFLAEAMERNDPDLMQSMFRSFLNTLMSSEASELCNAGYGEVSTERVNSRNGYRNRPFDTRLGTIDLSIPKLRSGTYYPDWLLEVRKRSEQALRLVIAQCYVEGVSTRRVDDIVKALGIDGISKSQVSLIAQDLDSVVEDFRNRPLDAGPYAYLWIDALYIKVREGGRVASVAMLIATAVNAEGRREIVGVDVITTEDGAGWTAFLRGLVARGLNGVKLVISDAHVGIKAAIDAVLPAASWQRCRAHFMRNLLTKVPKAAQGMVSGLVRTIFEQPDHKSVRAQFDVVLQKLLEQFPDAAQLLSDAEEEVLAFSTFPHEHWKQIWSNNPQERLNKEVRRRTDVVGIFPNRAALVRLVGALLCEQSDEWQVVGRCYMTTESLKRTQLRVIDGANTTDKSTELEESQELERVS